MKKYKTFALKLLILAFVAACSLYAVLFFKYSTPDYRRYTSLSSHPQPGDLEIKDAFLQTAAHDKKFTLLFSYFVQGAAKYATEHKERIHYPGAGSYHGYKISGLEGFARTGALMAAWIYSGRESIHNNLNIIDFLKNGLIAGTSPDSPAYWGDMSDCDQRIVEAADIARILWLTKNVIWNTLSSTEKNQIIAWITQVRHHQITDNNWILFPITIGVIMRDLGVDMPGDIKKAWEDYKNRYYLANGWFYDPPEGVDYYNTWGISYEMFWLHYVDKNFDPDFLPSAIKNSADLTAHLISPHGVPIMGRSICYRGAIPSPLLATALLEQNSEAQGLARHALNLVWSYFISNGCLREGSVTQGYLEQDLRFVETYSGPGSCQWSTRSLTLAFMHAPDNMFWRVQPVPVPVKVNDFSVSLPELGWKIVGDRATGDIRIIIESNSAALQKIQPYSAWLRIIEFFSQSPRRPKNHGIKYLEREYSAINPFPCRQK